MSDPGSNPRAPVPSEEFATTHWSVVTLAKQQNSPEAAEALEKLCRTYWYPLYVYIRKRGHSPDDAQDLTQEFFARVLEKHSFTTADPAKGRFRSFLLGALHHFLADAYDRARTQKRGGQHTVISWEQDSAEARFGLESVDELSPDRLFDQRWALTVIEQATARLRDEYRAAGNARTFEHLKGYVTGEQQTPSYAETGALLGLSDSAIKSAIYRLRQRYHSLVREEVAHTVANPNELEAEIRHLMSVFSRPAATFAPEFLSTGVKTR